MRAGCRGQLPGLHHGGGHTAAGSRLCARLPVSGLGAGRQPVGWVRLACEMGAASMLCILGTRLNSFFTYKPEQLSAHLLSTHLPPLLHVVVTCVVAPPGRGSSQSSSPQPSVSLSSGSLALPWGAPAWWLARCEWWLAGGWPWPSRTGLGMGLGCRGSGAEVWPGAAVRNACEAARKAVKCAHPVSTPAAA